ncbi:hypothetical protein F2Q70_00016765 [Brassica cretica]|uniref:Uncharacterized protein n=1 Tax=Brassica cretica TaxID=69181 RepID=A0A8S9KTK5_BRACR|nr:hypothetical protein F2Q70_00016765 [Brassica cretica]KAF2597071.1 hypothetical protein F2Q68_00009738 [Brassica cretica]
MVAWNSRSFQSAEGFSARLKQSAPVVPAARDQPVQQHPAELGWSAAFEASIVASIATEQ